MSGTTTIDTAPTRRPRTERPDRQIHREEPEQQSVVIEGGGGPTPEEALAQSQGLLRQRETQLADARQRAANADTARANAEAQARQAVTSQVNDRASAAAARLQAGESQVASAKIAYAAAREAGDVAAEIAAQEALSTGNYEAMEARREIEWLKAQQRQAPQQQQVQQQDQPAAPSPAAQRWLDEHPRFNTDDDYRGAAEGLHGRALAAGKVNGSQEYVDYIEAGMTRLFGEGHGQAGGGSRNMDRDDPPARGGEAMRPSGGSDRAGAGAGWQEAEFGIGHNGGMLKVRYRGPPENRKIEILGRNQKEDLANIHQGAETVLGKAYEADPKRAVAEYINEQILHYEEGSPDLKRGDGQAWR